MLLAETEPWWQSGLLAVFVGAVLGFFPSFVLFKAQRKADREDWFRDQRFVVYRQLSETLRSSEQMRDAVDLLRSGELSDNAHFDVRRKNAPVTLRTALAGARLVAGEDVRACVAQVERTVAAIDRNEDGSGTPNQIEAVANATEALERAIRKELNSDRPKTS